MICVQKQEQKGRGNINDGVKKIQKIDCIIYSSEDNMLRIIFRLYPRRSHIHGFDKTPPKSWSKVYKVYFSYSIIKQTKTIPEDRWRSETVYKEDFDECSRLKSVVDAIEEIKNNQFHVINPIKLCPSGEGTEWNIVNSYDYSFTSYITFEIFQSSTHKGYRFALSREELVNFQGTLQYFLDYMLEHSEGI